MILARLHLHTLMVIVPLAGVVLAIEAGAWIGPFGEGLLMVLMLSIAWVPAVSLLLDPKCVGWLGMLVGSAMALAPCLAALGVRSNNRVRTPSPGVRSAPGGRISGPARMSSILCGGLRLR